MKKLCSSREVEVLPEPRNLPVAALLGVVGSKEIMVVLHGFLSALLHSKASPSLKSQSRKLIQTLSTAAASHEVALHLLMSLSMANNPPTKSIVVVDRVRDLAGITAHQQVVEQSTLVAVMAGVWSVVQVQAVAEVDCSCRRHIEEVARFPGLRRHKYTNNERPARVSLAAMHRAVVKLIDTQSHILRRIIF